MKIPRRGSGSSFTFSFKAGASPATKAVKLALAITEPEWREQGISKNPKNIAPTKDLDTLVDRLTALMLIRMVGWIQPEGTYTDLSTTTIAKEIIAKKGMWPASVTQQVMDQVKLYVGRMLENYQKVPYHNLEHCYHVSISVNKVMDMILEPLSKYDPESLDNPPPDTYGFKDDPLMQMAMMFAALVHDVHHQGIPNRQLANEDDQLAVLYNDTAIAEQNSLYFAFSELLKPRYKEFREAVFPHDQDYRRFRKAVVNLVLCTDIADPERSQLIKSKWKEAFGDPYETIERKVRRARKSSIGSSMASARPAPTRTSRRMSTQSIMSDLSFDSHPKIPGMMDNQVLKDDSSVSLSPDEESSTEENPKDSDEEDDEEEEEIELNDADQPGPPPAPPVAAPADGETLAKRPRSASATSHSEASSTSGPVRIPSKASQFKVYHNPLSAKGIPLSPKQTRTRNRVPRINKDLGGALMAPLKGVGNAMRQRRSNDSQSGSVVEERRMADMADRYRRRLSEDGGDESKRKYTRLGLLRTVDLTGEQIDHYKPSRRASAVGGLPPPQNGQKSAAAPTKSHEELNELREMVVMETILLACDVAHNLQGWEQMAKWSNKLYLELRKAHAMGRGADPTDGWYNNQIGFLEAYLLPLARRLDDTGVFGTERGGIFANIVMANRERWGVEGVSLTANVIRKGSEQFPEDESEWGDDWSC
ncbi:unnamed protein product [Cylindrotheca closterium]|uniref:HD/PDEase domain-containing protein n=1 Tax=Cylindrotheca closterium TaxID=2856 RepID=A0AAD2JQ74_9STRA|nr:unnamed protein product [Cylindrotheca closterium]